MSSSPIEEPTDTATNKRRSGRVTRKPAVYAASPSTTKRKRDATEEDGDEEDEEQGQEGVEGVQEDDEEDSGSGSDEGEPDEEEMREKRRRAAKPKARGAPAAKKPAAKRPKTNGAPVSLPVRSAGAGARKGERRKRAKAKPAVDEAAAEEVGGLYAEVFARGHTMHDITTEWLRSFEEHEPQALADVVNFVLRCAGCQLDVSSHDVEDPDNVTGRLEDLQGEFQAQNVTEYPIIAKGKGTAAFKDTFVDFFHTLTKAIHNSGLLLANEELHENLQLWISTMSAAQNRPFRHTATVASLAIMTALCEIGSELVDASATSLRHSESQRKQKKPNKSRVSELQKESREAKQKQEKLDALLKDWFEVVYIHRYRDVDPHIRVDCVKALGDCIMTYPDLFFDGQHLRYLGWVLSDPNHTARHEVVKQLQRFYRDKEKLGGLTTFTDRFRARMVEMATRDADPGVRASAVELLDLLREGGLLEPDDIDAVGRLIFDSEARVRKAVVPFFAESITDAYHAKIDALGGRESLDEVLSEDAEPFDVPCYQWIMLKCLAEGLESYDAVDGDLPTNIERGPGQDNYHIHAGIIESRFMVAADTLYENVEELRKWESLTGYLLYDFSGDDQNAELTAELRLSEREEIILLEALNASVKGMITALIEAQSDKRTKKTKKQREQVEAEQETSARHLANLIPRLLKKFGESPQTATTILRLERVVNLEAFQEFRQDSTTYAALLDDINKQFMTHSNEEVLAEASRALLRAKSYAELGDTTDEKIETLWEDTISTFSTLTRGVDLQRRGNMSSSVLDAVNKAVLRLEKLSTIANPREYLDTAPTLAPSSSRKSQSAAPNPPIDSLLALVSRALPSSSKRQRPDDASLEDGLAMHASRTATFYFMWRVNELSAALKSTNSTLTDDDIDALALRRDAYVAALTSILLARPVRDDLALSIAGMLLDLHTVMATLRHVPAHPKHGEDHLGLALEIPAPLQKRLIRIFGAAELAFAKAAGRHLETAAEDDPEDPDDADVNAEPADPIDADDPEASSSDAALSDDAEEGATAPNGAAAAAASQARRAQKLERSLVAEQRLCELAAKIVLAALGGMLDVRVVRKRLERNKKHLGNNFKEVLAYLEAEEGGRGVRKGKGRARGGAAAKGQAQGKAGARSEEVVAVEDDIDSDEDGALQEQQQAQEQEQEQEQQMEMEQDPIEDDDEEEEEEEPEDAIEEDADGDAHNAPVEEEEEREEHEEQDEESVLGD